MNEEQNNLKNALKGTLKAFGKKILVIAIIVVGAILLCGGAFYYIKRDDFNTASDINSTYSTEVNSQGRITYTRTDGDGNVIEVTPEEMAQDLQSVLQQYISSDDEEYIETMEFLIGAETVTTMPYIDTLSSDEINGKIKFYRYTDTDEVNADDVIEENRLKYKPLAEFNAKLEAYRSNAVANRDIFDYFTIDEEGTVLVAYGSEEYRNINTGVDGAAKDRDLTVDIVNEMSTSTGNYSGNSDSGFLATENSVTTKPVDYLSLVEQYVMPTNLLYSFLIQTENVDFVKAIANLAYESEIAIGIYDNKSYREESKTYTYKKLMKMNVKTSFDYKDTLVSITDSDPSIILKEEDLAASPYEYIPVRCEVETNDNGEVKHGKTYKKEGFSGWTTVQGNKMYIGGTNANNEITSLGDGETYKTKYTKTKTTMSAPTIGVLLADTWIAKWEATYIKEETVTPSSTTPETGLENREIASYTNSNIISAFSTNFRNTISTRLTEHADAIRRNTINEIISSTPDSIFVVQPEQIRISHRDRKTVLENHLEEHAICRTRLRYAGYDPNADINTFFYAVVNATSGEGLLGQVKADYDEAWNEFVAEIEYRNSNAVQIAQQETEQRKAEFETQLNEEGTISYTQTLSGTKQYVNILFGSSSSGNSSKYERSETISRTEDGEKFSEVFNADEFHSVRGIFDEIGSWFWEYIDQNDDTSKLKDILKYLLNIATDSDDFGTFTPEEIDDLFDAFEPEEEMTSTSTTGSRVLQDYLHAWEDDIIQAYLDGRIGYTAEVSQRITEDKQNYIITEDGDGNLVVGFGVDIYNGDFVDEFQEAGYEIALGVQIPVDFVDALEEDEISMWKDYIDNLLNENGIELELYQKIALYSRAYNCGGYGATREVNGKTFIEAYIAYYNPEEDNKYGETLGNEIFEHELYTQYMNQPTNPGTTVEAGLILRRKSEWILFRTGYMDRLERWCGDGEYPDAIRTFEVNGYIFPEYPQDSDVGDVSLYAGERFGYPEANRTLGSSGCGVFSMSMILSGLLGDGTIDPITYRDAMEQDERIGYSYHAWNPATGESNGSNWEVLCNEDFLNENYGVQVEEKWVSYDTAIEALGQGKCILALEPGHYVSIIPVPDELQGQGYEFFVLDSARGHTGAYSSVEDFKQRTGQTSLTFLAIIAP